MSDRSVAKLAADDDDALRLLVGCEKYIYVEYLDWMGQAVLGGDADSGEITCFGCKSVIGSWIWNPNERFDIL